jgi:tetratricopeptide (TPR) repeat protein
MTRLMHGYGLIKADQFDAGIAELTKAAAWFEQSGLPYTYCHALLYVAEGHLARGDSATARPLIEDALKRSRSNGYVHYEALAHRLMADCLAKGDSATAAEHADHALRMFEGIGMRNDVAKALATKARLRQAAGDFASARALLAEADAIIEMLGTRDESRTKAEMDLAAHAQPIVNQPPAAGLPRQRDGRRLHDRPRAN